MPTTVSRLLLYVFRVSGEGTARLILAFAEPARPRGQVRPVQARVRRLPRLQPRVVCEEKVQLEHISPAYATAEGADGGEVGLRSFAGPQVGALTLFPEQRTSRAGRRLNKKVKCNNISQ